MLVKRHVFEKLNSHPAVKPFNNDIGLPKELDKYLKTYYDTAVRENRYYSEDWTFCENWRDLGGKVWVDKRVLLKHTGTYVFDFAAQEPLYKALHEMAQQNPQSLPSNTQTPAAASSSAATTAAPAAKEPVQARVIASNKHKPAAKKPAARKAKTPKAT
jgi:hypothetical protein